MNIWLFPSFQPSSATFCCVCIPYFRLLSHVAKAGVVHLGLGRLRAVTVNNESIIAWSGRRQSDALAGWNVILPLSPRLAEVVEIQNAVKGVQPWLA